MEVCKPFPKQVHSNIKGRILGGSWGQVLPSDLLSNTPKMEGQDFSRKCLYPSLIRVSPAGSRQRPFPVMPYLHGLEKGQKAGPDPTSTGTLPSPFPFNALRPGRSPGALKVFCYTLGNARRLLHPHLIKSPERPDPL